MVILEFQKWYFEKRKEIVDGKGIDDCYYEGYLEAFDECYKKLNELVEKETEAD